MVTVRERENASGRLHRGVIHVAGLKALGESVQKPLLYWDVNRNGSRPLVEAMGRHGCRTLVGEPQQFPITEAFATNPLHPYAQTKLAVAWLLAAQIRRASPTTCSRSSPRWPAARGRRTLRIFGSDWSPPACQKANPRGHPCLLFRVVEA